MAAMVSGHECYGIRIPEQCSIFSAHALLLALNHIENTLQKKFSKSCLQAMDTVKMDHPLMDCILTKVDYLNQSFTGFLDMLDFQEMSELTLRLGSS